MSVINNILATKGHWLPVGRNGFHPKRWLLLEGNRYGVIVALLLLVFVTNLTAGTIWTFELQQLLTETSAVQTLLNTFLSGIILLVSIVVSTSSIVLSYDITSLDNQENRMEAAMEFRRNIDELSDKNTNPTDPSSFVKSMTQVIRGRVEDLDDATESSDKEFAETLQEYTEGVVETLDSVDKSVGKSERGSSVHCGMVSKWGTALISTARTGSRCHTKQRCPTSTVRSSTNWSKRSNSSPREGVLQDAVLQSGDIPALSGTVGHLPADDSRRRLVDTGD